MHPDDLNDLARKLGRSLCRCSDGACDLLANDPGLCRALMRLLADGEPVSAEALARTAGRTPEEILDVVDKSRNVELDGEGRIVGAGLSLRPTPHRLSVGGRTLYTWCALDALMYPALLDMVVEVTSPCASSGATVRARVSASGVRDVRPTTAVVSLVRPRGDLGVREGFCNDVHFFRSARAAGPWVAGHAGAQLLSVEEAFQLGRRLSAA